MKTVNMFSDNMTIGAHSARLIDRHDTDRAIAVLLISSGCRSEFREALRTIGRDARVTRVGDLPAACRLLSAGEYTADIILATCDRPGQHRPDLLDELAMLAPLSRVTLLLGSWCEGEQRTGLPWPGARRVFWYDWMPHWQREMAAIRENRCPAWGLPATSTRQERLLMPSVESPVSADGLLVVCASCYETADAIADAAHQRGYSVVCTHGKSANAHLRGATVAIWEGIDGGRHDIKRLRRIRQSLGDTPVLAILDFPRIDSLSALHHAGVSAVIAKPFCLEDLFGQVEQLATGPRHLPADRSPRQHSGVA